MIQVVYTLNTAFEPLFTAFEPLFEIKKIKMVKNSL